MPHSIWRRARGMTGRVPRVRVLRWSSWRRLMRSVTARTGSSAVHQTHAPPTPARTRRVWRSSWSVSGLVVVTGVSRLVSVSGVPGVSVISLVWIFIILITVVSTVAALTGFNVIVFAATSIVVTGALGPATTSSSSSSAAASWFTSLRLFRPRGFLAIFTDLFYIRFLVSIPTIRVSLVTLVNVEAELFPQSLRQIFTWRLRLRVHVGAATCLTRRPGPGGWAVVTVIADTIWTKTYVFDVYL